MAAENSDARQEIRNRLWNDNVATQSYANEQEKYRSAIMDQYRIYVNMADKISHRRGLTNTYFLTLNTAILTTLATFWQKTPPGTSAGWLTFPFLVLLVQCGAWFILMHSYRRLNAVKYQVVSLLEERLPASPYWKGEWVTLNEEKDWKKKYLPLSHVEQWVPVAFAAIYSFGFAAILFAKCNE
ncbi:hypothetical protein [Streptomyces sp. NPDC058964]|uniref:RipA family octameric membrane protein n=1 Tax=Streptomyces sp. NPDC058964 TaxID=3346681 RepID=UPI0036798784